ncbi:glutamate 5-kinase [Bacteroidia bacterium]|nr:glutamate 5-kinase [Bacteroidia bacterium]
MAKIGSNVLTADDGSLDVARMELLVGQIAGLMRDGVEVIVVSSGAVASGRTEVRHPAGRLDAVSARQLYSAVGQAKLINIYFDLFASRDMLCGQVLTTRENFSSRRHYLNQRNCMEVMLSNGVVPVVNENDAISVTELMFTDNDELSGLVATMMGADALALLSNVDGIFDGDPASGRAQVIRRIEQGGADVGDYIQATRSQFGRGGMLTKSRIAAKVAAEGIEVIIANGKREGILSALILGDEDVLCTRFVPAVKPMSGVKKWIAHSDGFAKGEVHINEGAYRALLMPKATSLLYVGVSRIDGEFEKDDIVKIVAPGGRVIGVGKASTDSAKARTMVGRKGARPLIHYDYLHLE